MRWYWNGNALVSVSVWEWGRALSGGGIYREDLYQRQWIQVLALRHFLKLEVTSTSSSPIEPVDWSIKDNPDNFGNWRNPHSPASPQKGCQVTCHRPNSNSKTTFTWLSWLSLFPLSSGIDSRILGLWITNATGMWCTNTSICYSLGAGKIHFWPHSLSFYLSVSSDPFILVVAYPPYQLPYPSLCLCEPFDQALFLHVWLGSYTLLCLQQIPSVIDAVWTNWHICFVSNQVTFD